MDLVAHPVMFRWNSSIIVSGIIFPTVKTWSYIVILIKHFALTEPREPVRPYFPAVQILTFSCSSLTTDSIKLVIDRFAQSCMHGTLLIVRTWEESYFSKILHPCHFFRAHGTNDLERIA